jgi:HK97 gp10 family phage protein
VNIRATSNFKPGSLAAFEAKLVPKLIAATSKGTGIVEATAKELAPVDTGDLVSKISSTVAWEGQKVTGSVVSASDHGAYVEFGTGVRGAASLGAGPYPYNPEWAGMPAQPHMRPAIDQNHEQILDAFKEEGFR